MRRLLSRPDDLYLGRTSTSDAGLKHLAVLKHLTLLNLVGTKITDAGLNSLTGLQEGALFLWPIPQSLYRSVTNREVERPTDPSAWRDGSHRCGSEGARKTSTPAATRFRRNEDHRRRHSGASIASRVVPVSLFGTAVSDAGLKELRQLDKLTDLDLSQTKITDAGCKS